MYEPMTSSSSSTENESHPNHRDPSTDRDRAIHPFVESTLPYSRHISPSSSHCDAHRLTASLSFTTHVLGIASRLVSVARRANRTTINMTSSTTKTSTDNLVERGKQAASIAAVERHVVRDGMAIGIGSGSTVVYAVKRLGELARERGWSNIACVPTSFQSRQLITAEKNLILSDLSRHPKLDVAVDGADEVDPELNCIKGGGAAHLQEKIVASCAPGHFVLVCDERKKSQRLGSTWKKGIPIEVVPSAYVPVSLALTELGGKPTLRMAVAKAGPVVTDNGNFVMDADFGEISDAYSLNAQISAIPGVVETGLFLDMAVECYIGKSDGTVEVLRRETKGASPTKRERNDR